MFPADVQSRRFNYRRTLRRFGCFRRSRRDIFHHTSLFCPVQRIVNSYGTVVAAAFTAANLIGQLIHQPYTTLSASLATYCGQNFGARKHGRVITGYKKGTVIMSALTVLLMLLMQVLGRSITSLFVTDQKVIDRLYHSAVYDAVPGARSSRHMDICGYRMTP